MIGPDGRTDNNLAYFSFNLNRKFKSGKHNFEKTNLVASE